MQHPDDERFHVSFPHAFFQAGRFNLELQRSGDLERRYVPIGTNRVGNEWSYEFQGGNQELMVQAIMLIGAS